MAGICIPKSISSKLKEAFASKDISVEKLWDMTSEERHDVFENYVGEKNASVVNSEFEKAKLAGFKKAAADYVTASEKEAFGKKMGEAEFAKKLLTDEQTKKLATDKLNKQIEDSQKKQNEISIQLKEAEGEDKANLQFKLEKLKSQESKLNLKKDQLESPVKDRMLNKINKLNTLLSPKEEEGFMKDLVQTKMGEELTPEQGKYIVNEATRLQGMLKDKSNVNMSGVSPEYLNTRNELNQYINNLNPDPSGVSIIKNLIGIARNNLITSIATPLKTYISGMTNHNMAVLVRRLSSLSLKGENANLAKQINKENWETFKKTGMNTAGMESINDSSSIMGGKKSGKIVGREGIAPESFEAPKTIGGKAAGMAEKAVSKVAEISHKIAINLEHNVPFTRIYGKTFADALNFRASDMAKAEGLKGSEKTTRASELMKDATKIEPQTEAGKMLRNQAQEIASRVLNVNDTWASRFSVGMKNGANKIAPNVPIGDLIEPIAKIPANIIANGINNTPIGIPEGIWDTVKGKYNMGADDLETRYKGMMQYKNGIEHLIRIFGSVAVASVIVSNLSKKDFRSDQYGNHFIKVGNNWINSEYFASISPAIAGAMAAKLSGGNGAIPSYLTASLSGLLHIPGAEEAQRTFKSITGGTAVKDVTAQAGTRLLPAGIQNLFKDRPINRLFFGATGLESDEQVKTDVKAKAQKAAATKKAKGPTLKAPKQLI